MNSLTNPTDGPFDESEPSLLQYFGPSKHPEELGTLARYRVRRQIGLGGMGAVYLALDDVLDRSVALKVMRPAQAAHPLARERFLREARAAAKVKSDHVIKVFDVGESNGMPFLAMEYLQGEPLDQRLKSRRQLSIPEILRIGRETAAGLADAHALGLVHRDIKPANLWMETPKDRVVILDFGLARQSKDAQLTQSGMVIGTPTFMSPEQARGEPIDGRSDLFSLGAVLYRLCAGRLPFPGDNPMEVLTRLATEDPTPVRGLNPQVPDRLARLIHRLLAKNPRDRYAQASDVVRAIAEIEGSGAGAGLSGAAPDPEIPGEEATVTRNTRSPAAPPIRKRKSLALAALLGVGTVAILAGLATLYDRTRDFRQSGTENGPPVQQVVAAPPAPPAPTAFEILTSREWTWSAPENLGPAVNTANAEYSPVVTSDERRLVYNGVMGKPWMILEATRENPKQPFGNVTKVEPGGEFLSATQPWISGDGLTLMVSRQRPGGTDQDVWMCRRTSVTSPWGRMEQLSRNVNSDFSEESPAMSPDRRTLYFVSNRAGSRNHDIWRCRRSIPEGEWEPAERLGVEINTEVAERCPRVLSDGKSITFTRRGDNETHFWMAATPLPAGGWDVRMICKISNKGTFDPSFAADGMTVWCSGDGAGSVGASDLWQMKRVPVRP